MYKIFWLFLLLIVLQSCKLPTESSQANNINHSKSAIFYKEEGLNRLDDQSFIIDIKQSCIQSTTCKYFSILNTDSYFPEYIKNNELNFYKYKNNIMLSKQYYLGPKNNEGEYNSKSITLNSIKNKKIVDSLKIYLLELGDYYFVERIYYIDNDFSIWLLDVYSEEDTLFVKSWRRYTIDSKTGKFEEDPEVYINSDNNDSIPPFVDTLFK